MKVFEDELIENPDMFSDDFEFLLSNNDVLLHVEKWVK